MAWCGEGMQGLLTIPTFTVGLLPTWLRNDGAMTLRDDPKGASLALLGLRKA